MSKQYTIREFFRSMPGALLAKERARNNLPIYDGVARGEDVIPFRKHSVGGEFRELK